MPIRFYLTACCLACCATTPLAATLHGTVVRVADGDTVTVADARHRKVKVRLNGIDAPEKLQAFGRQAGAHLAALVMGRPVTVLWDKRDAYGRVIGKVLVAPAGCAGCGDTEDAGLAQIVAGYAWWYRSESRELRQEDRSRYALAENAARSRHLGLWAAPQPVPPWQWRHARAGNTPALLAGTSAGIKKVKTFLLHPGRGRHRARAPATF